MEKVITEKLWNYIVSNNPDLMLTLKEEGSVFQYLKNKVQSVQPLIEELEEQNKPAYIIEEICLEELTRELRPSKYHYIKTLVEEEFEDSFLAMVESGVLTYEIVNMMLACQDIFESFNFSEQSEDDRFLRYAVIGEVSAYLMGTV
ncbi:DUF1896 family protein [Pedobacter sp.]|jgi:hypothetical protein|uniref:DUF1896 family protein n=1 Tax=Pedobacter sp. TaxID=1411316 RepID=UPI002C14E535|nr:DUF1896 family protein [Pedobacter sp.]HWW41376.1 DUF1896 family protein [Pedobacter sp.]